MTQLSHSPPPTPAIRSRLNRPLGAWPALVIAAVAGLGAGAVTDVLQKPMAGSDWFILVNSGAVWLTVAFLVGLLVPSRLWVAAVAGGVTEAGLVIGYYATAALRGYPVSSDSVTGWILTGLVGGPLVAAAAASLRDDRLPLRIVATSILGAVWIEEGIRILRFTGASSYGVAGWYEIAFGLMLPLVLGRSARDRLLGLLALPVVALAAHVFTGPVLELLLGIFYVGSI